MSVLGPRRHWTRDQQPDAAITYLLVPRANKHKTQISCAADARREALAEAVGEHKNALRDEKSFKKEHARCVMELSLREGLGQRYLC